MSHLDKELLNFVIYYFLQNVYELMNNLRFLFACGWFWNEFWYLAGFEVKQDDFTVENSNVY